VNTDKCHLLEERFNWLVASGWWLVVFWGTTDY